ncbi:matrixin family metalloprotease [Methylobacterium planeticum]|uniref:Matrixin family metalloprotease n=1 Tax=Methylobacterium planeticum TaxID=2615211 RepID=A0A6N6MMP1_9HYPH|nr:matrixin family metalloprotease [Methylobacterium planeticum]KAB1069608.1 matrixin family metalloprotease [Methylobacterium planeticum]
MAAYALEGPLWGAGATVSWAVDASIPAAFQPILTAAFADWSAHANITFVQAASASGAAIRFSNGAIDGLDNVLGQTRYTYFGNRFTSADITFDSGEGWHAAAGGIVSNHKASLFLVALHEIGHALGLDHYSGATAVMNPYLSSAVTDLTASDISGIQALYGAPAVASASPAPVPAIPTAAAVPSPTVASAGLHDSFRFFNAATNDHFYTSSVAERDWLINSKIGYVYEGVAWATPDAGPGTIDVFRFFDTAHGTHFYTTGVAERDQIIKTLPSYVYEGVAFEAYASPAAGGPGAVTLERFFNTQSGVHHFAGSAGEADAIRVGAAGAGWVDEGKAFTVHVPSDWLVT